MKKAPQIDNPCFKFLDNGNSQEYAAYEDQVLLPTA